METIGLLFLLVAALTGLGIVGYRWSKRRTAVRPDLFELDRQEDAYRFGFLDRLGRRAKSVRMRWLNRGKPHQSSDTV